MSGAVDVKSEKIGYNYFLVTNQKIKDAFDLYLKRKALSYKKFRDVARKIGANPLRALVADRSHGSFRFIGFNFDGPPKNPELFKKKDNGAYPPRMDSWIYEKIRTLGEESFQDVEDMLGWRPQFYGDRVSDFNPFYYNGHFGFRAPAFSDPTENYEPKVSGVKNITLDQYYKLMADKVVKNANKVRNPRGKKVQDKVGRNTKDSRDKGRGSDVLGDSAS